METTTPESRDPVEFLRSEFGRRRERNGAYSLRAFARHLGLSPARLSQLLSRKRPMTLGQVDKVINAFGLDPETHADFKSHCGAISRNKRVGTTQVPYATFKMDLFHLVADWYNSALLCLAETTGAKQQEQIPWFAKRLGISVVEARQAVERLCNLELMRAVGPRYLPTNKNVATSSDIPSAALRRLHHQMLDQAHAALDEQPVEDRDITSITMAIDTKKLPEAKKMIADFRRSLCAFLESGERDEVYALNLQLIQLSK